jgi:pyridoxal phosphate enzyme (YggS family)
MAEHAPQSPGSAPVNVAANLAAVRARIAAAARAAGGDPAAVTLVAISKTFAPERIRPVLEAGHRTFGENRVQEAAAKWPGLRAAFPDLALHLVGHLQTNKVREAVALFDVIETVDRPKLARALCREMERSGRRPACYVQVNTGEEPQKGGVAPGEAGALIAACRDQYRLPLQGLMCLPPIDQDPVPHFEMLRALAARHRLAVLSMGMSADFEAAIRCGATHVRLGTAIFGPRG